MMNREKLHLSISALLFFVVSANGASISSSEVRKKGELDVRNIVEPLLNQFCHDQCKVINVDVDVDIAAEEDSLIGFESTGGKATLAPAGAKVKLLMDSNLGKQTEYKITEILKTHLEALKFPVTLETAAKAFPLPPAANYKVAELKDRIQREVKGNIQSLLNQFCGNHCILGDFEVQTEQVNLEDVEGSSGQDVYQDGPAAVRVRGVKAQVTVDQTLSAEEANTVTEMIKLKLSQFKNVSVVSQALKFPKPSDETVGTGSGRGGLGAWGSDEEKDTTKSETNESKSNHLSDSKETTSKSDVSQKSEQSTHSHTANDKYERYEKIERVENGDAVQQKLDAFKMYALIFGAVMLALLITLVAISFRSVVGEGKAKFADQGPHPAGGSKATSHPSGASSDGGSLSTDEKANLIGKRFEADRLFHDLTNIFSEQPKVAKHVFAQVITEEGVESTAQYVEIFGETIMFDLLRDPGLQSDLAELMDFYARNTFEINDEERLVLLRRLHHRTVSAKMMVHGSRSATLFDFLAEMDAPQIFEMIKNESNTVKAIVLTQCDTKKRQMIFAQHDEGNRIKLMTELSRIDHLPKNYIFNVATALRRKKTENPKLNTEALPGTDVLVSFLERSTMDTQRRILTQLMTASADILQGLKGKLVSVETLRFVKDSQLVEVVTGVKHEELIQFLQGCSPEVREAVLSKGPQDLTAEIREQMSFAEPVGRETYFAVERKVLNRIKVLANQGLINLTEVNERLFAQEIGSNSGYGSLADDDESRRAS